MKELIVEHVSRLEESLVREKEGSGIVMNLCVYMCACQSNFVHTYSYPHTYMPSCFAHVCK